MDIWTVCCTLYVMSFYSFFALTLLDLVRNKDADASNRTGVDPVLTALAEEWSFKVFPLSDDSCMIRISQICELPLLRLLRHISVSRTRVLFRWIQTLIDSDRFSIIFLDIFFYFCFVIFSVVFPASINSTKDDLRFLLNFSHREFPPHEAPAYNTSSS